MEMERILSIALLKAVNSDRSHVQTGTPRPGTLERKNVWGKGGGRLGGFANDDISDIIATAGPWPTPPW